MFPRHAHDEKTAGRLVVIIFRLSRPLLEEPMRTRANDGGQKTRTVQERMYDETARGPVGHGQSYARPKVITPCPAS
jgi:hypothetical protein